MYPPQSAPGDYRNFVNLIHFSHEMAHQRVTGLVEGCDKLFLSADNAALPFRSSDDAVDGFLQMDHLYGGLVLTSRQNRALIEQVFEIGSSESRCLFGQREQIDILVQGLTACVDFQDRLSTFDVGPVEDDLPVESARPQQRRVEDVWTVRGSENDNPLCRSQSRPFRRGSG